MRRTCKLVQLRDCSLSLQGFWDLYGVSKEESLLTITSPGHWVCPGVSYKTIEAHLHYAQLTSVGRNPNPSLEL